MQSLLQELLENQYLASIQTLLKCAEECPDPQWNTPIAKYPLSQVLYHTLFFADFYLSLNPDAFRKQAFHAENRELFEGYEQLSEREPTSTYRRDQIAAYGSFCRQKVVNTIATETEASFAAACQFPRKDFSRAELHVYNIRHLQHHAAQIILRLRVDTIVDVPWYRSGWQEGF